MKYEIAENGFVAIPIFNIKNKGNRPFDCSQLASNLKIKVDIGEYFYLCIKWVLGDTLRIEGRETIIILLLL